MAFANSDREFLQQFMPPAPSVSPARTTAMSMPGASGQPPASAPTAPESLPRLPEEASSMFEQVHGRAPTAQEARMVSATPWITRSLGRPPSRVELLQYTDQRETQAPMQDQFEVGGAV